jgi:hypothetical protein
MSTSGRDPLPPDSGSVGKDDKDFAEHLRTVQFTLLAICLALTVVVTSPTRTDIAIAHQQILDILEIQKRWDPLWVEKVAERRIKEDKGGPGQLWVEKYREQSAAVGRPLREATETKAIEIERQKFNVQFAGPSWWVTGVHGTPSNILGIPLPQRAIPYERPYSHVPPVPAPKTLSEFRELWNSLPGLRLWILPLWEGRREGRTASSFEVNTGGFGGWRAVPWKEITPSQKYKTIVFRMAPPDAGNPNEKGMYAVYYVDSSYVGPGSPSRPWLRLPVSFDVSSVLDAQEFLVETFPDRMRHGAFAQAFHELNVATQTYQENLPLDAAEKILRSEKERSKEVFEAFGVKFPVEAAAKWGVSILVVVQMYFWLHLAEYRRRRIVNPPVAWIGSYDSMFARSVFLISTIVAPFFVACFVVYQGKLIASSKSLKWTSIILVALIFSGLFSVLTAFSYFDHRLVKGHEEQKT